jgi:hypothetical protein
VDVVIVVVVVGVALSYGFGSAATDLNSQNKVHSSSSIIQVI